jgi:hypothetical protein
MKRKIKNVIASYKATAVHIRKDGYFIQLVPLSSCRDRRKKEMHKKRSTILSAAKRRLLKKSNDSKKRKFTIVKII